MPQLTIIKLSIPIEGLDAPFYLYYVWDKSYLLRENDMKKFKVVFSDVFEAEDELKAYDELIDYLRDCVKMEDVSAFGFEEEKERATTTRYELLQSLERLYPSRKDWFICDEDEGIVKVCFNIEVEGDSDEQPLSDIEPKGGK